MNTATEDVIDWLVDGYSVVVNNDLGCLTVEHDGSIGWEDLQSIKNKAWGPAARAIEVYPDQSKVNGNYRHLWLLGSQDFCPDMLGHEGDTLAQRSAKVWSKSE